MQIASSTMSIDFSVRWRPFFLDARLPGGEGTDKMAHYKRKFGAERVAQLAPRMIQTFRDEGIPGYTMEGRVGNTMDSHRLLEYAHTQGGAAKQDALMEELFDRYFLKGHALSSRSVLLDAAAAAELDGAQQFLESDEQQEAVWAEVERAYASGVSGVPHFRIDGGGGAKEISGGQPPEVFLQIFASLGPPPAALGLAVGSAVRVVGLQAKPELNGKVGSVMGAQGADRVQVRLPGGVELALKRANLEEAEEA